MFSFIVILKLDAAKVIISPLRKGASGERLGRKRRDDGEECRPGRWVDNGFAEELRSSILNIATVDYVLRYARVNTVRLVYGCRGGLWSML